MGDLVVPLGQTVYQIGYRLWRDPVYGIPVIAKAWTFRAITLVAVQLVTLQLFQELRDPIPPDEVGIMPGPFTLGGVNQNSTLDTKYYPVGKLMARFFIQWVDDLRPVDPLSAMLKMNLEVLKALAKPLEKMKPQDDAFAMEGEIYAPNTTSLEVSTGEKGGKQIIARWNLSVRDRGEL